MARHTAPRLPLPLVGLCALACAAGLAAAPAAHAGTAATRDAAQGKPAARAKAAAPKPKRQLGKASYYHPSLHGRPMADGTPMRPEANNAASKTLPLGTTARVTNLRNGQSAVVEIRDRGPYVPGRVIDLSPSTAREIGLDRKTGVVPVEVVPLHVPADTADDAPPG